MWCVRARALKHTLRFVENIKFDFCFYATLRLINVAFGTAFIFHTLADSHFCEKNKRAHAHKKKSIFLYNVDVDKTFRQTNVPHTFYSVDA